MLKQTVLWTALPNGIKKGHTQSLRLSAMISPRLMADASDPTIRQDGTVELKHFSDFLNWPRMQPRFSISFENGPTLKANIVGSAPQFDLWKALFPPQTSVLPYVFNPDKDHLRRIRSYPVGNLHWLIKRIYREVAQHNPIEFPRFDRPEWEYLQELIPRIDDELILENMLELKRALQRESIKNRTNSQWRWDFTQLKQFYAPRDPEKRVNPQVPSLDFHQVVSSLGDYPLMMRYLGLVYDLEVDLDVGIPSNGSVTITPTWSPTLDNSIDRCPHTRYELDLVKNKFISAPASTDTEIIEGYLKLVDPTVDPNNEVDLYTVTQLDADSAAIKFLDFIRNIAGNRDWDRSKGNSLPSLRSHGISIAYSDRAQELYQSLNKSVQLNTDLESGGGFLSAEHLVRGYRVDVWDSISNKWHSLCNRNGKYHFLRSDRVIEEKDEGFIEMALTAAADGSTKDLNLHQSLFTWGGWSLVAPRPGIADSTSANSEFKLETHFKPFPKSLPNLRYGGTYRFRLRTVDLAGNSRDLKEDSSHTDITQTRELFYSRYEPVESPVVVLTYGTGPGESIHTLVLRNNYDGVAERHIVPPKVTQLMAEQHGCFDTPSGIDPGSYGLMTKNNGSFDSGPHSEEQLVIPYISDPISRGAAFLGLPGMENDKTKKVPFSSFPWEDSVSFRFQIQEGTGKPIWDSQNRLLIVYLPKAESTTVRMSSFLSESDLELMGFYRMFEETPSETDQAGNTPSPTVDQLRTYALNGRHWMLTPYRELTLVHAVLQPLIPPAYQNLTSKRDLGQTSATLADFIKICGKSTVKIDINASWKEPVDALSESNWKVLSQNSHVCEIKVNSDMTEVPLGYRHEFGDTKYRRVTYTADATSRFSEYFQFPAQEVCTLYRTEPIQLSHNLIVEQTEIVLSKDMDIQYEREKDYTIDYARGTIARTTTGAIQNGENVEIKYSYFPGPITITSEKSFSLDILNSAPPAAPKVLYAVPTFSWEPQHDVKGKKIKRKGGSLRIYLDRPWYSSGDGELLGIILWPDPNTSPPTNVEPYITKWAKDSIRKDESIFPPLPQSNHFTRATNVANVKLEELPNREVQVVGHNVEYDSIRKLWFCEVDINTLDANFPFIRLALTRYQPNSVEGAHLSRVVLMDYIQVAPDRLFSIEKDASNPMKLMVNLAGPFYLSALDGTLGGEVEVQLETKESRSLNQGWLPVPNARYPLSIMEDSKKWSTQITLPIPRGEELYRLIVFEYERFEIDETNNNNTDRRLVFAAELEI